MTTQCPSNSHAFYKKGTNMSFKVVGILITHFTTSFTCNHETTVQYSSQHSLHYLVKYVLVSMRTKVVLDGMHSSLPQPIFSYGLNLRSTQASLYTRYKIHFAFKEYTLVSSNMVIQVSILLHLHQLVFLFVHDC